MAMLYNGYQKMVVRKYVPSDCETLARLFYDTVHSVNAKDYTKEQLDAWASGTVDLEMWNRTFLEHNTLVAVADDKIVGFGDMDQDGYLDRLYVHRDYQGRGIAAAICDGLEKAALSDGFSTHASITAKPFFEKRGYQVIRKQTVVRHGIGLTNFVMEKKERDRSMELFFKKASAADLDFLTKTRIEVLRAANRLDETVDMSLVEQQTREYYRTALECGDHVAYLVFADGVFAGTGGISFYRVMPTYHNPTGYKSYIMNMYTRPEYRRMGIANKTLDLLVAASREKGIFHITLEATDMGRPLYEKYGFVKSQDEMELPQ